MTSFSQWESRPYLLTVASIIVDIPVGQKIYDGAVAPVAMKILGEEKCAEWGDVLNLVTQTSLILGLTYTLLWLARARS